MFSRSRGVAPTNTARGKQKPVHEDSSAVVVWVVSEEAMPLVLLLTAAVTGTSRRARPRASLLMDGLFEMLRVDDSTNFPG